VLKKGFTIVELLIVVVVIAILATVTIVAYNGISQKAKNTSITSGVRQYLQAIEAYQSFNGQYPMNSRMSANEHIAMSCLGSGYAGNQCGVVTGQTVTVDSQFDTQLKTLISSTPQIGKYSVGITSETFIGAAYGYDITGATSTGRALTIQYALYGTSADCGISQAYAYETSGGNTACEIILQEVPNN